MQLRYAYALKRRRHTHRPLFTLSRRSGVFDCHRYRLSRIGPASHPSRINHITMHARSTARHLFHSPPSVNISAITRLSVIARLLSLASLLPYPTASVNALNYPTCIPDVFHFAALDMPVPTLEHGYSHAFHQASNQCRVHGNT